jgi:hypothetical protein
MSYLISLFAPESAGISATGSWRVAADSLEQAINMAKFYVDRRLWPAGSTWLVIPLDDSSAEPQAGSWDLS